MHYYVRSLLLVMAVILLGSVCCGCRKTSKNANTIEPARFTRSTPTNKGIQNPGDPALTYEVVETNPAAYQGKRVTWFGTLWGGENEWGTKGKENPWFFVLAANHGEVAVTSDLRFFAFEAKDQVLKDRQWQGWVTGTLKGTWKPTSPDEYDPLPKDAVLPLLTDVEFEVYKTLR